MATTSRPAAVTGVVDARRYAPIGDYAIIGDCHTAALISREGSIDWLCPGRFDAPAVFCRLLDADRGGYLSVRPVGEFAAQRRYRGATNVLETEFQTAAGRVHVTDLMPIHGRGEPHHGYDVGTSARVLRRLECVAGEVELELIFKPTFDYGRAPTRIALGRAGRAVAQAGAERLTLALDAQLEQTGAAEVRARLRVQSGTVRWIALTAGAGSDAPGDDPSAPPACEHQLRQTLEYWRQWAGRCTYRGPYRDAVLRSALVLKLLTFEPTGAIVAAPTTSLPEQLGGERNWDYRFTWLRDSSLVLYALQTLGYDREATDFMGWLQRTLTNDASSEPQIMYGIDGRRDLTERIVHSLEGYAGSAPVRVGNAAAAQRQIDIFGEVLRSAALHYQHAAAPSHQAWALMRALVERAATDWSYDEQGIWEVRGGARQFLYGKLMCWAALEAGLELADKHKLDAPVERWRSVRETIRRAILERGYNKTIGAFTQALDSDVLDASVLIIPRTNFLPPSDPRMRSTLDQVRRYLMRDGLVYRYRTADGLVGGEGTFTLCTLWLADALAQSGQVEAARETLDRVMGLANDVGLLAEEIDPATGQQLGNFPQGFSHLALIGAAVNLARFEQRD